ncbi:hypothetical protein FP828_03700 [bacterium]|nr:hypothetical protein [Candidatus Omnitrophota bacterium]MBA3065577.1 hypothetical protein [bacterium]
MNKLSTELDKRSLGMSGINMLFKCGEQFRRRYIMNEIVPPGIALIIGSSTHKSIEVDLTEKKDTGKLAPGDLLAEIASEQIKGAWDKGVILNDDEKLAGKRATRNDAINTAIAMSNLHHEIVAPTIEPINLEDYFSFDISGTNWKLAGTSDIEEKVAGGIGLRDTKTAGKSPGKTDADDSRQLTMYSLKVLKQTGSLPKHIQQDYLIKNKTPKYVSQETERTAGDIKTLLVCVAQAIKVIESGIFTPCSTSAWWCAPAYCGYFGTCKYRRRG